MDLKKIGVIAGAFDPMHSGHLQFIKDSIKQYGLDKVLVLIEKQSRHKKSFAGFEHRKKIAELTIKNLPSVELYESSSDSFPISSTLPKIKSEFKAKTYLLIGDDVKEHITSWQNSASILKDVELIVADRNHSGGHSRVSSGKVREQIKSKTNTADMQEDALNYCLSNRLYI